MSELDNKCSSEHDCSWKQGRLDDLERTLNVLCDEHTDHWSVTEQGLATMDKNNGHAVFAVLYVLVVIAFTTNPYWRAVFATSVLCLDVFRWSTFNVSIPNITQKTILVIALVTLFPLTLFYLKATNNRSMTQTNSTSLSQLDIPGWQQLVVLVAPRYQLGNFISVDIEFPSFLTCDISSHMDLVVLNRPGVCTFFISI